ncbi:alkyl hydroperoxide reductase, partial [Gordonia sihwensis]
MPDCARGRRRRAQALVGAMLIGATVLTACGTGTDAVSAVRANQFVSPDGQTVI